METSIVETPQEAEELDQLLWEVLWKPLGFPRDIRQMFKIDGESIELVISPDYSRNLKNKKPQSAY